MKILSIRPERKHLSGIEFSEAYLPKGAKCNKQGLLLIDSDYIEEAKIKVGQVYEYTDIDEMYIESEKRRAKSRALWYLSRRDYASGELVNKLAQNFPHAAAEYAVCRMCELGLIDDRRYAEALAETLINIKGNAPKVAIMLMRQKGVDKELALEVVSSREDNLKEVIEKLIENKYERYLVNEKGFNRVYNALVRKGFSYGDVCRALEKYKQTDY